MYVIESLHPDGWRPQGRMEDPSMAYQEALTRCRSNGRHYRIRNVHTGELVLSLDARSASPEPLIASAPQVTEPLTAPPSPPTAEASGGERQG